MALPTAAPAFLPSLPLARRHAAIPQVCRATARCPRRPGVLRAVSTVPQPPALPHDRGTGVVADVVSTGDFLAAMARAAEANAPAFVLFHAGYCRACMFVAPKFAGLADEYGGSNAVFASVLVEDADELTARLGVTQIPLVQVYDGKSGKVKEFKCGPKSVGYLRSVVDQYAR
jgi:thioredoxin-like negative regulator of GroEL